MIDLPLPVKRHLTQLATVDHAPAYLVTDRRGLLLRWGGRTGDYGLEDLKAGTDLGEAVFFLDGLLPLEGDVPLVLTRLETLSGRHADVHVFVEGAEYWVLFLDVSEQVHQAGLVQQEAHELSLLKDQLTKLLGAPQAAKTELVERVRDQIRIASLTNRLMEANRELATRQAALDADLAAAAEIQRALLPKAFPSGAGLSFAHSFQPSEMIGGDIFNVYSLAGGRVAGYMLDVSGHGVPAALVTVSVSQSLQPQGALVTDAESGLPNSPRRVIEGLDLEYPMDRFEKMFSMVYLVYDPAARNLTYCNAAHPYPLLIRPGRPVEMLKTGGTLVGLSGVLPFEEQTVEFRPGERLILYTDGVIEHRNPAGDFFGEELLLEIVDRTRDESVTDAVAAIMAEVDRFGQGSRPLDDVTVLGIQAV